jgi:hypothetical protein
MKEACDKFRQTACTAVPPCDDCRGWCVCGFTYADHFRGFGSNVQQLSGRVKRVPRA